MFKKIAFNTLIAGALITFFGCGDGYKTTDDGLQYKIHTDAEGAPGQIGDMVSLRMKVYNAKDSLLEDGFTYPTPIEFVLQQATFKGGIEEGLLLLSKGDSATFKVPVDSMFNEAKGRERPKFLEKGSLMSFIIKIVDVVPNKEFKKKRIDFAKTQLNRVMQMPSAVKQGLTDDKILQEYFTKNKITPLKSDFGLYYTIETLGTGKQVVAGDSTTLHYTGTLLVTGKEFDSSKKHGKPFTFNVGLGEVIPGWDLGIALFKVGTKAKLYIPSTLAYGDKQAGPDITPNSILIFDVEVLKSK